MSAAKFKPVEEQLAYIKKGAAEIIPESELKAKLEKSFRTGTPLRVYLGVDPTAPDIHLGHTVVLRKLKHFQDLGHTAIFLIGDFSAMIGDPTGRSETRPPLSREEVDANAQTYLAQVFKLLDKDKTEVRRNSEWLDKLTSQEIVRLCAKYPLARMLEREDFRERLAAAASWKESLFRPREVTTDAVANDPGFTFPSKGKTSPTIRPSSISIHELLYPLLTAIDAVELKSDVELGATEQKFNILVHRDIQREYGLEGEVAVTMPILVGRDGQRKMSKSFDNYVGITEPPKEMFGKLMSIPDDLMWSYYELLTDLPQTEIDAMKKKADSGELHRKKAKENLAVQIVDSFHPVEMGDDGSIVPTTLGTSTAAEFNSIFRDGKTPSEMPEWKLTRVPGGLICFLRISPNLIKSLTLSLPSGQVKWSKLLADLELAASTSDAERIIKGNGFEVNKKVVRDPSARINVDLPGSYEVRVGKKKFARIVVEAPK